MSNISARCVCYRRAYGAEPSRLGSLADDYWTFGVLIGRSAVGALFKSISVRSTDSGDGGFIIQIAVGKSLLPFRRAMLRLISLVLRARCQFSAEIRAI